MVVRRLPLLPAYLLKVPTVCNQIGSGSFAFHVFCFLRAVVISLFPFAGPLISPFEGFPAGTQEMGARRRRTRRAGIGEWKPCAYTGFLCFAWLISVDCIVVDVAAVLLVCLLLACVHGPSPSPPLCVSAFIACLSSPFLPGHSLSTQAHELLLARLSALH
ncbi:hypothetical protein BDY17DRAFT_67738 [Neohortaea acidophila]|uniref:Uncharacterized protein n=1 Tax=Neohortaea acidophila TaxID=245834 RepID=A0A6A6Q0D6_9PEZI|nr:uncharacterized protein BDY17DRAFT_67738 [Neohortaea acidophila]KAF2485938.1 hypothetical protein BDY17DRAFT_67738 [Neohortaea acidophila]